MQIDQTALKAAAQEMMKRWPLDWLEESDALEAAVMVAKAYEAAKLSAQPDGKSDE